jgi:hypothetical protein
MVVNSVMVGFFTSVTKPLSADAVRKAARDSVPSSLRELNLKAFEKGYEYGVNARVGAPSGVRGSGVHTGIDPARPRSQLPHDGMPAKLPLVPVPPELALGA